MSTVFKDMLGLMLRVLEACLPNPLSTTYNATMYQNLIKLAIVLFLLSMMCERLADFFKHYLSEVNTASAAGGSESSN